MKKILFLFTFAIFLAMPAAAESWFIEGGTWYVKPDNNFDIGYRSYHDSDTDGFDFFSFENDEDFSYFLNLGYDTGDFGIISVYYWIFGDETAMYFNSFDGEYRAFYADDFLDELYNVTIDPGRNWWTAETDSWQVDIKWSNAFAENEGPWSGRYHIGLRAFDYEQENSALMRYPTGDSYYRHDLITTSDGYGLAAGLSGKYSISDVFRAEAGFDTAFLDGEMDYCWLLVDGVDDAELIYTLTEEEYFVHFGLYAEATFFIWEGFYGTIGYRFAKWLDSNYVYDYYVDTEVDDVSWGGLYVSFGYEFGRYRSWY